MWHLYFAKFLIVIHINVMKYIFKLFLLELFFAALFLLKKIKCLSVTFPMLSFLCLIKSS